MMIQDLANYTIIIYGISIPLYIISRGLSLMKIKKLDNIPVIETGNDIRFRRMQKIMQPMDRIRMLVNDNNKSVNQRITELKKIVR